MTMKPDSTRTTETKLQIYEASLSTSSVRIDYDEITSAVVHVHDGQQQVTMRLHLSTMVCLEHCLRQLLADVEEERK